MVPVVRLVMNLGVYMGAEVAEVELVGAALVVGQVSYRGPDFAEYEVPAQDG